MSEELTPRRFLFLSGPHGPFFRMLAEALEARGCGVCRVLFNAADRAEWGGRLPALRFHPGRDSFPEWFAEACRREGITDLVVYGDARRSHRAALAHARANGILAHVFEEGYLRPRFITYERGGTNGWSRLCDIPLPEMAGVIGQIGPPEEEAANDTWGDSFQHRLYALVYYLRLLVTGGSAMRDTARLKLPIWREVIWYVMRAMMLPFIRLKRDLQQAYLIRRGKRFHLVLLQLSFDASVREHSDYQDTAQFIEEVVDAFAEGAPDDELLVFKAHPFENGRERLGRVIRDVSRDLGIGGRVFYIDGGKRLAPLMNAARSVVTINSTGAQQALWRGLPVAARGRAVYRKPALTSDQDLASFFEHPRRPDLRFYWVFRKFMLETSQLHGSFYAIAGIRRLLDTLPDAMLQPEDRYDRVLAGRGLAGQADMEENGGEHHGGMRRDDKNVT